jgi:hypothetical protein
MHPFAQLEKQAMPAAGRLAWQGVKSLWNNGAWKTLGRMTTKGMARGGNVGRVSRAVNPVAKVMSGRVGNALGLYGLAGFGGQALGYDLPGSRLAFNLSMPIIGAMNTTANLIRANRAGSEQGKAGIKKDIEAGADRAMQDFISGIHIDPNVAQDADAYRNFVGQVGGDVGLADAYTAQKFKPMTGFNKLRNVLDNPQDVIKNEMRMQIQEKLPSIMKQARISSIAGKVLKHGLTGLGVTTAAAGLGNAIFGNKAHDADAAQREGYAAAQAAIQNRLRNMSSMERMAAKMDPSLAADAIRKKFPEAFKSWEAKHGPLQRGIIGGTINAFTNPGAAKFYSTDMAGNKNFIN